MKMLNASIYIFIILNFVKKDILDIHLTTATDICMKNVIDSFLRRTLLRKIIETLKALIIIHCTKFSQQGSFFLLFCQFVFFLIDSSSRIDVLLNFLHN